jgi:CBS domain-containing protein
MIAIRQLMTPKLITVEAGTSAIDAAKLMQAHRIGSVFVQRDSRIVGIVTETDIVRKVVAGDRVPCFVPVEQVMSAPVVGIEEHRPITEAADLMEEHHARHLAVTKAGQIVGVVSVRDLLRPVSIDEF